MDTPTYEKYGVSFSLKQCAAFQLDPVETLEWLINDAGFKRFRLMSYWNEHEKKQGRCSFKLLDQQVDIIEKAGGQITMCLGVRQPRWPENHWPEWAWELPNKERSAALLNYIEKVVNRYKNRNVIVSWQLENEALLKEFGRRPDVNRQRLIEEYGLVKKLDSSRPIIMSTSNGWGIPMRKPIPDLVGFSYYGIMHKNGKYRATIHRPWLYIARKVIIHAWWGRKSFIHELQCEPWGHDSIWKMSIEDQSKSMDTERIAKIIADAKSINAGPIDLWGAEWWYWRYKKHNDLSIWRAVHAALETE